MGRAPERVPLFWSGDHLNHGESRHSEAERLFLGFYGGGETPVIPKKRGGRVRYSCFYSQPREGAFHVALVPLRIS